MAQSHSCTITWSVIAMFIIIVVSTWPYRSLHKEKYQEAVDKEAIREINRDYVPSERVTIAGSSKAGFPIKTPSIDTCRTSCDNDMDCVAYSYDGYTEECDLKTNTKTLQLNDNRYRTTFFKEPRRFESTGYHGWTNMRAQGKDIAVQTNVTRLSDCDLLCKHPNNIQSCVGFVYDQRDNTCQIKSNITEMNATPGFDTFVKVN